jgi:[CysO sulfur-carrier protein]-S-L-cysteine hydrolase
LAQEFQLPEDMFNDIVGHALREAPRECCGVLTGRGGSPERLRPMTNVADGNRFYEIDPTQLIELEFQELPKDDSEIVAIYHSHPESPAYPSRTDVELAFWPEAVYLICSLEHPAEPVVRGFRIHDGAITEVALMR